MANQINWRQQVVFGTGDTIRVHQTITEGSKTRTQVFEGVVIRIRGHQGLKSFTVRKIATGGIGVEKIFPEDVPTVTMIEVKKKGKVRRAVLSYLRKRVGRKATLVKDRFVKGAQIEESPAVIVTKAELSEEERNAAKMARLAIEEKAEKAAKKVEKEKKKSKKKAKIQRKEKVFVR